MGHLWKRGKVWYMGYQDRRGKWKQESTRTRDKQAAREALRQRERATARGEEKLLAEWLREYLKTRTDLDALTVTRYTNCVDALTYEHSPLAGVTLQGLNSGHVDAFVSWRLKHGRRKLTVKKEVSFLKAALDAAVRRELLSFESAYLIKTDRRPALKKQKGDRRESYLLLPEEWAKMYAAADAFFRDAMTVAFWTGLRQGNVTGLRDRHFHLGDPDRNLPACLRFAQDEMKGNYAGVAVFLAPRVEAVLLARCSFNPATPDRLVFGDFVDRWQRFKKKHAPRGFRWHDFRANYASYRLAAGIDPKTVQDELGHETAAMTMDQYAKVLRNPIAREWAKKNFLWGPATHMQDEPSKNGPQSDKAPTVHELRG